MTHGETVVVAQQHANSIWKDITDAGNDFRLLFLSRVCYTGHSIETGGEMI